MRGIASFALAAALLVSSVTAPDARAQPASETDVKAAYLLRFASFVEWPPGAKPEGGRPLAIGVLQAEEIHDALAAMAASRGQIVVRRVQATDSLADLHVLLVGRAATGRLPQLARQLPPWTLVVADAENGLELGAMVNFRLVDERVRFEVALDRATAAGLRVSPRMLAVALRVRGGAP